MGQNVALAGPALVWARERFARYYGAAVVPVPEELTAREFAAFPFAEELQMRRHTAFRDGESLRRYLRAEVPRHVYYSSARYAEPDRPTMAAKGWRGADLIFDLDADHLRGAETLDYAGQLALVKERTIALYDDFLIDDLGVDPSTTQLVFSGGRGYHIHVREEAFRGLTSPERREIVDYILGTGIDARAVLGRPSARSENLAISLLAGWDSEEGGSRAPRPLRRPKLVLPEESAAGWSGHLSRALHRDLRRWSGQDVETVLSELVAMGVGKAAARRLAKALVTEGRAAAILQGGTLDVFRDLPSEELVAAVLRRATVEVQGETDAPVTTDIHRLIRLPGSLHGGTGFRVTPLARDRLDAFDPFRDAAPFVGTESTTVRLTRAVDYPFPAPVREEAGATVSLPDAQALFVMLRGEAELPAGSGS